ncbi:MAG: ribonuclease P [Candidatus Micrarchaeota archaeon]
MGRNTNVPPLRAIVEGRINILLAKALEVAKERPQDAKRYVQLACKLSMRHRISMGRERKRKFCKTCLMPLVEGQNLKISRQGVWEIYSCSCGGVRKFHL